MNEQSLSDDLGRVDMMVENLVRKIERAFSDLSVNDEVLDVAGGIIYGWRIFIFAVLITLRGLRFVFVSWQYQ